MCNSSGAEYIYMHIKSLNMSHGKLLLVDSLGWNEEVFGLSRFGVKSGISVLKLNKITLIIKLVHNHLQYRISKKTQLASNHQIEWEDTIK